MWRDGQFFYTKRLLKSIAQNYEVYADRPIYKMSEYRMSLLDHKADFDNALSSIGCGRWKGEIAPLKVYKYFGRAQQVVIAIILEIPDYELEAQGFWSLPSFRQYALGMMCNSLNGGKFNEH